MTKIIEKTMKRKSIKPILVKVVFGGALCLVALYVVLISSVVFSATESEKNLKKISAIEYQNIELEKEYLALTGKLDMDYARELGFVNKKAKIVYAAAGQSLSIR